MGKKYKNGGWKMKKLCAIGFIFMVLLSMTMSAAALESKIINRQNGMAAYADWMESTPGGLTTDTYLSATKSNDGTDIYLSICTYDTTSWSCKSGYKLTQDDVFSINSRLNSASLAVQVDLYQWYCDEYNCWNVPAGTATIETIWTGIGDISKGSYKWMSKSGDYMSKGSDSSSYRDATAKGSIDGSTLGASDFAEMSKFKSVYMSMKK